MARRLPKDVAWAEVVVEVAGGTFDSETRKLLAKSRRTVRRFSLALKRVIA